MTTKTPAKSAPKAKASIWRGYIVGAGPHVPSRLLGGNEALNEALHTLPGFTEQDIALRRHSADREKLDQRDAPNVDDLVTALADRYAAADDVDLPTEREAFTRADADARIEADFLESHTRAGEIIRARRETIAECGRDQLAEHLTGQLRALIDWTRAAGVTEDTARLAELTDRDLPDVLALREAVSEFRVIRSAVKTLHAETTSEATGPMGALIQVLANPLVCDPFWAVTFSGRFYAAREGDASGPIVKRDPVIPDFLHDSDEELLAWLSAHSEADVRVPTVSEANDAAAQLRAELGRAAGSVGGRMVQEILPGDEYLGHRITTLAPAPQGDGWTPDGDVTVWEIREIGEPIQEHTVVTAR